MKISTLVDFDTSIIINFGYKPLKISTLVDCKKLVNTFYFGYKPLKISTLVDSHALCCAMRGYKPLKISTLVDADGQYEQLKGYKPLKISTLVDGILCVLRDLGL